MIAAIRPADWELSLFVHVTGALILVGALTTALVLATTTGSARLTFRTLLWAAVPSFIVMRGAAEWVRETEDISGDDAPTWVGIGYMVSEPTLLLLIAATVVAGAGAKRGGRVPAWVSGLIGVMIAGSLVAVWAMTTKPT